MDIHVFPMTICETFLKINKVIKLFVLKILCLKAPNPHVRPVAAADSVYAMIRVCLRINKIPVKTKTKFITVKYRSGKIINIAPLTLYGKQLPTVK